MDSSELRQIDDDKLSVSSSDGIDYDSSDWEKELEEAYKYELTADDLQEIEMAKIKIAQPEDFFEGGSKSVTAGLIQAGPADAAAQKKMHQPIQKKNHTHDDIEKRKRKVLYGSRGLTRIFESATVNNNWNRLLGEDKVNKDNEPKNEQRNIKERIIISANSKWKAIFDVMILLLVGYSCVTSMFYASFSTTDDFVLNILDLVVEGFFWLDLVLNFLQSYKHPETYEIVKDLKKIAQNYVFHGWFIIDFISVFPFGMLMQSESDITKLFRLFRLPRLIKLIDISRFNKLLKSLMSNSSRDERIMQHYFLLYVYKIFRLIIIAIIITYFIGCCWWYFCESQQNEDPNENDFIKENDLSDEYQGHQLIVSCYYALTTLSTVGYGDYYPISNAERIMAVIIMLCGVAFFSYIMGNFIEILQNYQLKMGIEDKSAVLHDWLIHLTRYTNMQPLLRNLATQIEQDFLYHQANDRLACMDDQYLESLPMKIKTQIMTVYLFQDVFLKFRRFFKVDTPDEMNFLYDIAFGFLPRHFLPNDDDRIIYDEEQDVNEMYFIEEGIIGIAFSLISNGFACTKYSIGKRLVSGLNTNVQCSQTQQNHLICDHYVLNDCKCQFIYIALDREVKAFALVKSHLQEDVFPKYTEIVRKLREESAELYNKQIFTPLNNQRLNEVQNMNKKSVYRQIKIMEKAGDQDQDNNKANMQTPDADGTVADKTQIASQLNSEIISNKMIAEKMVERNLQNNVDNLRLDLNKITNLVHEMMEECEKKLDDAIEQVEENAKL